MPQRPCKQQIHLTEVETEAQDGALLGPSPRLWNELPQELGTITHLITLCFKRKVHFFDPNIWGERGEKKKCLYTTDASHSDYTTVLKGTQVLP